MSKTKAVASHFLISLLVVSTILAIIFLVWYPGPMFQINGAAGVLRTLIGVDLVLGPALTAYLYRPGKPGLWIDMWFIAIVQLSALIYGTSVIYTERPQYMIFSVDRFVVLTGKDIAQSDQPKPVCDTMDVLPCTAVALAPTTIEGRAELLQTTIDSGLELEQLPRYWAPLAEHLDAMLERAEPMQTIIAADPSWQPKIEKIAKRHGRDIDTLRHVPVINKSLEGFALIVDARTAEVLDVLPVDPWELRRSVQ